MSLNLSQTLYRKACCLDIEAEYGGTDGLTASQPQYDLEVMTGLCVSDLRICVRVPDSMSAEIVITKTSRIFSNPTVVCPITLKPSVKRSPSVTFSTSSSGNTGKVTNPAALRLFTKPAQAGFFRRPACMNEAA